MFDGHAQRKYNQGFSPLGMCVHIAQDTVKLQGRKRAQGTWLPPCNSHCRPGRRPNAREGTWKKHLSLLPAKPTPFRHRDPLIRMKVAVRAQPPAHSMREKELAVYHAATWHTAMYCDWAHFHTM